jgi:hypothetical protein
MKKLILPLIILALSCLFPAAIHASYIIHLENGGQLLTPQYWEEDNYVKFYIVGGTMGIEKNSVRKIERSTLDLGGIDEVKTPEKPPAQVEPKASMPGVPEKEERVTAKDDAKKDPAILREFKALQKRFESRNSMTINELKDLRNNLTVLRDKIVSNKKEDDFHEEADNISYMIYLTNDSIIKKSTGG